MKEKDWKGNKMTTFVQLGASNHSEGEREERDYYSTDPHTLKIFLEALNRDGIKLHNHIWENACGELHLSKTLEKFGYNVFSSDIISRKYKVNEIDFLKTKKDECLQGGFDILTNPPYKEALSFVKHSLELLNEGYYCVMLLKIQFLEGQERRKLFDKENPKYVYINSARQLCYPNGNMSKKISSASCYCWFIWQKGYKGETIARWI